MSTEATGLKRYLAGYRILGKAPRDFWIVNILNFFESTVFFSFYWIFANVYISKMSGAGYDVGIALLGVFGILLSVTVLIAGPLVDRLGVKLSFWIGFCSLLLSRVLLLQVTGSPEDQVLFTVNLLIYEFDVTGSIGWIMLLFILMAFGFNMYSTALTVSLKRYTTLAQRSPGFSMWYIVMNVGAVVAGLTIDFFIQTYGTGQIMIKNIFLFFIGLSIVSAFIGYFLPRAGFDAETQEQKRMQDETEKKVHPKQEASSSRNSKSTKKQEVVPDQDPVSATKRSYLTILREAFSDRTFFIMLLFLVLLIGVRIALANLNQIMSPYYMRVLSADMLQGGQANIWLSISPVLVLIAGIIVAVFLRMGIKRLDFGYLIFAISAVFFATTLGTTLISLFIGQEAIVGRLLSLNPLLIVVGILIIIPIVRQYNVFNTINVGIWISALSIMILAIPNSFMQSLGFSPRDGILVLIILQIVVFAIGEIIWSPRLMEYIATIAPKNREGSYLAFVNIPWYLAKVLIGLLIAPQLFKLYVPETTGQTLGQLPYAESPEMMWLIFGLMALSSPVFITIFRKLFKMKGQEEEEREKLLNEGKITEEQLKREELAED